MNTNVSFDLNQFFADYGLTAGIGIIFVLVVVYWLITKINTDAKTQITQAAQEKKDVSFKKDLEYEGEHNGQLNMQAEGAVSIDGDVKLKSGHNGTINITAGNVSANKED